MEARPFGIDSVPSSVVEREAFAVVGKRSKPEDEETGIMAKAIPNPEPPRFGGKSPLNPLDASGGDPWSSAGDLLGEKSGAANDEAVAQLQAENQELRQIIGELNQELEAANGKQDNDLGERQKEYERMLDEKTENIRTLHSKIQELQDQIRPPTPREEELFAMSEELERERAQLQQDRRKLEEEARQLKEDEDVMTEEMRKMEIQMARERADMARQRTELTRISEEIRQELERIERDKGLSEKLIQLRQRHTDIMRGRSGPGGQQQPPPRPGGPGGRPPAPAPTQMSIDLDSETPANNINTPPKPADPKKKDSGVLRRFFGSGG